MNNSSFYGNSRELLSEISALSSTEVINEHKDILLQLDHYVQVFLFCLNEDLDLRRNLLNSSFLLWSWWLNPGSKNHAKVAKYNRDQQQLTQIARQRGSGSIIDFIVPMAVSEMQIDHEILETNIFNTSTVIHEILKSFAPVLGAAIYIQQPDRASCLNAACNAVGIFTQKIGLPITTACHILAIAVVLATPPNQGDCLSELRNLLKEISAAEKLTLNRMDDDMIKVLNACVEVVEML